MACRIFVNVYLKPFYIRQSPVFYIDADTLKNTSGSLKKGTDNQIVVQEVIKKVGKLDKRPGSKSNVKAYKYTVRAFLNKSEPFKRGPDFLVISLRKKPFRSVIKTYGLFNRRTSLYYLSVHKHVQVFTNMPSL